MLGRDEGQCPGADVRVGSARRRIKTLVIGASAAMALSLAGAAGAEAVTVSPLPGTPDALPATQISILGTAPSNIESVTATGSSSGVHSGHLESYASEQGASYVLDAAFQEGEEVDAVVALKEGGTITDHFTIAHLAPPEKLLELEGEKPESLESFKTEPGLRPPKVQVNVADPSLEGDIFLDPLPAPTIHVGAKELEFEPVGPEGLMLLNPEGKLQWWHQFPANVVGTNLETVTYEGHPDIAWWEGVVTEAAWGEGEAVIANSAYEPVAHIKAGNGQSMDIHELDVTPGGQAWIDTVEPVCKPTCDESHLPVLDATVQEIDIHTGLVMWEWEAMGHVAESETEVVPANGVFDPYHLNSIQPLPNDRVLISLRDTSGVYLLNQDTGGIVWEIAGKKTSFTRTKETRFYFQHDARLEGKALDRLTVFADEAGPPAYGASRGLILQLKGSELKLVHQYLRPTVTVAGSEGSMQVLKHAHVMVGYGSTQYFSEFSKGGGGSRKRGKMIFDAQLPKGDSTYRVLRFNWEGTPSTMPKLAAERESLSEVALYASWNGATQVASWRVLAGESAESLATAGTYAWSGLETKMSVPSSDSVFEVQALDKSGHVLASSEPVTVP